MGDNTTSTEDKEKAHTLFYKASTDYDEDKKVGIKAVFITNEAELVEAGVDKNAANIIMQNLNPNNIKEGRIIVIKDADNKAVRVFGGYETGEYKRTDSSGGEHTVQSIMLLRTVDLKHPNETVEMDQPVVLDPTHGGPLEQRHVDTIEKAISRKEIGMTPRNPAFDAALAMGHSGARQYEGPQTVGTVVPSTGKGTSV